MEPNWFIIGIVCIGALVLIRYLIRQNRSDKKDVTDYFNTDASNFKDDESELNDEN